jgi:DNA-binding transcriptional LysR family regulator
MLTLRQIEVVRAVMLSGSIAGAARLLNVAQPGISRTMKHVESLVKVKLFVRQGGRFVPAPEARDVFRQLNEVNKKIEDLSFAIDELTSGKGVELRIGSVPSIGHVMVPRAIARLKRRFPHLVINIDILKIEEAIDYLMLGKGELVLMSHVWPNTGLRYDPLSRGHLVCITAPGHPLAQRASVTAEDLAAYPLIGIDPRDPYGKIMVELFERGKVSYELAIRARFGTSVVGLVKQNLGVAIIDVFTIADLMPDDVAVIPLAAPTSFETYVAHRSDVSLSGFAEAFVRDVRATMAATIADKAERPRPRLVREAG